MARHFFCDLAPFCSKGGVTLRRPGRQVDTEPQKIRVAVAIGDDSQPDPAQKDGQPRDLNSTALSLPRDLLFPGIFSWPRQTHAGLEVRVWICGLEFVPFDASATGEPPTSG